METSRAGRVIGGCYLMFRLSLNGVLESTWCAIAQRVRLTRSCMSSLRYAQRSVFSTVLGDKPSNAAIGRPRIPCAVRATICRWRRDRIFGSGSWQIKYEFIVAHNALSIDRAGSVTEQAGKLSIMCRR